VNPPKRSELNVEAAVQTAPVTEGFPAVTPAFLVLLRRHGWAQSASLHGGALFGRSPRGRFLRRHGIFDYITPFRFSTRGKCVWWIGDSAARCAIGRATFDALCRGKALPDGRVRIAGKTRTLLFSTDRRPYRVRLA